MKRIYIFNIYEGGIIDQIIFITNQVGAKILKTKIHEFQKLEINLRPILVKMSTQWKRYGKSSIYIYGFFFLNKKQFVLIKYTVSLMLRDYTCKYLQPGKSCRCKCRRSKGIMNNLICINNAFCIKSNVTAFIEILWK